MRETGIVFRISDFQLKKLDEIVKYHNSTRNLILRRGLFLLDKYNLKFKNYEDNGNKVNSIKIPLNDLDREYMNDLIKRLEKKHNKKYSDLIRYGIYIQSLTIKDLEELEKEIILRD